MRRLRGDTQAHQGEATRAGPRGTEGEWDGGGPQARVADVGAVPFLTPSEGYAGAHGFAGRLRSGTGRPGPGPVLRYGPGGLRGAGGACGPAGHPRRPEPDGQGQALARRGSEAAAGSGGVAVAVRPGGCGAGVLPPW